MNKAERFRAAVTGGSPDRPPVGCWIHYGSATWTPEQAAEVHLRFLADYDWDYVKVMNDFRLDMPAGLVEARDPADLAEVGSPDLRYTAHEAQRQTLRLVRAGAAGAPVLDTMFSPVQTVIRALGESVLPILRADPALANATLSRVTDRLVDYIGRLGEVGVDGLFLSINGASNDAGGLGLTGDEFRAWVAPHDRRVLQAAQGLVRVIHVHGYDVQPELVADYPAEVLSWSHHHTVPTLADVDADGTRVPMGGLDELACLYWPPSAVRAGVRAALDETGGRMIVGPGCTVHSDTPPTVLRALRDSVEV